MSRIVSDDELIKKRGQLLKSATDRGIVFTLSLKKLYSLLKQKRCFYTGIPFDDSTEELKRSIDRVESDLGYTDDNTVACICRLNSNKGKLSYREIVLIEKGMAKHLQKKGKNPKQIGTKKLDYELNNTNNKSAFKQPETT